MDKFDKIIKRCLNEVVEKITSENKEQMANTKISSILMDDVPLSYYFTQEKCDRMVYYNKPTRTAGEIGYVENGTGKHQSNAVFSPEYPARTLMACDHKSPLAVLCPPNPNAGMVEYNGKTYSIRRLTPNEYWLLQGCANDDFNKINGHVANSHIYKIVGNSICVNVLADVFKKYLSDYIGTGKPLRVFESFSGMGTQAMALKKLGINVQNVCTSEIEPNAILSYAMIHSGLEPNDPRIEEVDYDEAKDFLLQHKIGLNFKTGEVDIPRSPKKVKQIYLACILSKNMGDITGVNPSEVPDMDLFTFSSPCTDISRAGAQQGFQEGSNTRSSLLWESEKILREKQPKFIMMENVKDIISPKFKPDLDRWIEILEGYGYHCEWTVENAVNHNTPQIRERFILFGVHK